MSIHLTTNSENKWSKTLQLMGEINKSTILVGDFNMILSIFAETRRQKINKNV